MKIIYTRDFDEVKKGTTIEATEAAALAAINAGAARRAPEVTSKPEPTPAEGAKPKATGN